MEYREYQFILLQDLKYCNSKFAGCRWGAYISIFLELVIEFTFLSSLQMFNPVKVGSYLC